MPRNCSMNPSERFLKRAAVATVAGLVLGMSQSPARADDVSAPVILQWFESKWTTIEKRMPDFFMAGYGGMWTPPPFQADTSDLSTGYDVYDRFDLGSSTNPTLFGTEGGVKKMISETHKASGRNYLDLVWNHNGYSTWSSTDGSGHTFLNAGGYPGFYMSSGSGSYGDFH